MVNLMAGSSLPPILFEDDDMLVFDKPSGMLVAPDRWDKKAENLMDLIHAKLSPEIFNVHRLDKDTSGLVLCAKTKPALDFLSGQFQARTVQKKYLAIIQGSLPENEVTSTSPIREDPARPGLMKISKTGKPAETQFRQLESWRAYAFIEAHPLTGRTHQIRVHLKELGCPVVMDPFYSEIPEPLYLSRLKKRYKLRRDDEEKPLMNRLALHASELSILHPATREPTTLVAPSPRDFELSLKYLKKFG
jgi:RluA family pseudouridine synthase